MSREVPKNKAPGSDDVGVPAQSKQNSPSVTGRGPVPRGPGLTAQVVSQLRAFVDQLPIGTKLPPEAELAKSMAVGRSTVREATQVLSHMGLLEARQGAGTFVASRAADDALVDTLQSARVEEVFEARLALEKALIELACSRRRTQDLRAMRSAQAACRRASTAEDVGAFLRADHLFHTALAQASRNPVLAGLYDNLRGGQPAAADALGHLLDLGSVVAFHDKLIAWVQDRDAVAAVRGAEDEVAEALAVVSVAVGGRTRRQRPASQKA